MAGWIRVVQNAPVEPTGTQRPLETSATLDSPVSVLRGVGPERVQLLDRLGIRSVRDLLFHAPRRFEDRRRLARIRDVELGGTVTVRGRVLTLGVTRYRSGKSVFQLVVDDGSSRLHCRWWNLPFLERMFAVGDELLVCGRVKAMRPRTMDHPETEKVLAGDEERIHVDRWVPFYPLTEGLTQRVLRGLTWQAVEVFGHLLTEPYPDLPIRMQKVRPAVELGGEQLTLEARSVPDRSQAIGWLHFPDEPWQADLARQRFALDEFVDLQLTIQRRRRRLEANATGLPCSGDNRWMRLFLPRLGFPLTGAQQKVLGEIRSDLGGAVPMRRLLQGDVGSGKTLVAVAASIMVLESGYSVAVMAPTEILAGQLHHNFRRWLVPLGIEVSLHTGSRKPDPETGSKGVPRVVVGTHALIEDGFGINDLGLVVIDEQHRFGVVQRERLLRKGRYPHLLVMTATPIPRTLGLTLYGDLDVSILDELPGGRRTIKTHLRTREALPRVWVFVRRQLEQGRQAYVVYPRIDAGESDDLRAVTSEHERIRLEMRPYRVGLLHGQLSAEQKETVMNEFRAGVVHLLMATTVVEVGVDVPNATVMVVEDADQFGLAQLHQLRGRIGRGAHASHCILISGRETAEASSRLRVMERTTNGFEIAEADLALRGPGDLVGRQQSGVPDFRFGDLRRDRGLVEMARDLVCKGLDSGLVSTSP
jgi:ATP-dependent DNA helicase RecG